MSGLPERPPEDRPRPSSVPELGGAEPGGREDRRPAAAAAMAIGGAALFVGALLPWWSLRVGAETTAYVGVRGWSGWIALALGTGAASAGLWLLSDGPGRRSVLAAGGAGLGAGALVTCVVAATDRVGGLALDLGPFAGIEGLSVSLQPGLVVAAAGAILVLAAGVWASRAPRVAQSRPSPPGAGLVHAP